MNVTKHTRQAVTVDAMVASDEANQAVNEVYRERS